MTTDVNIYFNIATTLIGIIFTAILTRFMAQQKKVEAEAARERKLHHAKTEAIVEGLKEMNGNTSIKFGQTYDRVLDKKLKELNFVEG